MLISRLSEAVRLAVKWRMATFVVGALAMVFATGLIGTSAEAKDLPFWERADAQKAAAHKSNTRKYTSRKASSKKYAAKKYASKTSSRKHASKKSAKRHAATKASRKHASKKSHTRKHTAHKSRKKLGGYAAASEKTKRKSKGVRVASLGNSAYGTSSGSLTGGGVRWVASAGCLDAGLKAVVYRVASNFGPVTVNSTCRSRSRNRAVGGASKSKHLTGDAVDFRVRGNISAVYAFLRSSSVGGLKHYGGGLFHIDNGARRSW